MIPFNVRVCYSMFVVMNLGCIGSSSSAVHQNQPDNRPPDPRQQFLDSCGKDLDSLCPNEGMAWQLYCLYSYPKDQLSVDCQNYLGSSTIGGCNEEAKSLCGTEREVSEIVACLKNNKDKLSSDCLRNIEKSARQSNPMKMMQDAILQSTRRVTNLGLVFLLVPLFISGYAWYWVNIVLAKEQQNILKENPSVWKANAEVDEPFSSKRADLWEAQGAWCLSFFRLNYWAIERKSWREPFTVTKKKILQDVSGQLQAGKVTAIMGPSGSGKTTLLKLIGGQMYGGEFSGLRGINRLIPEERKTYDEIMRRQGFVAQHDCLLSSLTVWQTLMFAALLRLPQEMTLRKKLHRAAYIMNDVGLTHIAHNYVGEHNGGQTAGATSEGKCISGGQRRRLSIALELLASPSAILLDEPTSGLDGASTLKVVTSLRDMSRAYHTTICLTIHQPRGEVFDLFDCLILLGSGGKVVYYGTSNAAAGILAAAPFLQGKLFSFDNPGDFIIDLLGLDESDPDNRHEQLPNTSQSNSTTPNRTVMLANHFESTSLSKDLTIELQNVFHRAVINENRVEEETRIAMPVFSATNTAKTVLRRDGNISNRQYSALSREDDELHSDLDRNDIEMTVLVPSEADIGGNMATEHSTESVVVQRTLEDDSFDVSDRAISFLSNLSNWILRCPKRVNDSSTCSYRNYKSSERYHPSSFFEQALAIFGRRYYAFSPSLTEFVSLLGQIVFVGLVVSITFSYEVSTEFELPYQVLMLISLISLYAMILQYLLLTPEYMVERQTVIHDTMSGYASAGSYVFAVMLTEIPRGVLHSSILMTIQCSIHRLNPNTINLRFAIVCLMVGVSSWQGLITICSVVTDSIGVAYSIAFLVLSSGTLFGGLLVRLEKIPILFKFFYYFSVPAVTQRALITNDMQCCYLTATCNSISYDLRSSADSHKSSVLSHVNATTTFCPPGLEFTGDGSDFGNLGRFYLMGMGLEEDHPFMSLLFLCVTNVLFRMIAVFILRYRLSSKDALKKLG